MMFLRLLVAVVFHLPIVLSFPHQPTHIGLLSTDPPLPTVTAPSIPTSLPPPSTTPTPTTTGDPWKDMCKPGAECDCSRIQDKNGEEYFQCVTNPRCDHCWINLTTTSTRPPPATTPTPITNFLRTDYQTLLPGTYTSSSGGTAHVVIVQQPSRSVSIRVVTATVTAVPLCEAPSGDVRRNVRWKR
ncbi:hypothetical protein ACQKWADRAFT_313595 [Trichoderma austrokoningii]